MIRTTRSVIRFSAPFTLSTIDGVQKPGDYAIDQDEEPIEGISWLAYQRVATFIHLPAIGSQSRTSMMVPVDQFEFDAVLDADRKHTADIAAVSQGKS